MEPLGYVVGEVQTDRFVFVTNTEMAPPRLEYVVVRGVLEPSIASGQQVEVLAQVTRLAVFSRLLDPTLNFQEIEVIRRRANVSPPIVLAETTVLGYLGDDGRVRFPRGVVVPGAEVYRASDDLLQAFFSTQEDEGLHIGTLLNRPNVRVILDPNGLRRHLAVIAQTGAGKSYTVGVVLEQLLQRGGTIVVFDPNSDYVLMRRARNGHLTPFASRVQVYRLPTSQRRRVSDAAIGEVQPLRVRFSALDADEICDITGISDRAYNIRHAVRTAVRRLGEQDFTPEDLVNELEHMAYGGDSTDLSPDADEEEDVENSTETSSLSKDEIAGAQKALKYIERLTHESIWGFDDLPIDRLLRPMSLSVIDLAGADFWLSDFVVEKVLREIWYRALTQGLAYPVFVVLEEAHNFVPNNGGRRAAQIIRRIASEGRKFGIFLVLITQRPYRIHQDTLSQCNSQIIMRLTNPEDQNAVRRSSEGISERLLADLPGLNVGEAVIVGPLVRAPVMVQVAGRASQEGGNDLDVVAALKRARDEVITENMKAEVQAEKRTRGRTEWEEEV